MNIIEKRDYLDIKNHNIYILLTITNIKEIKKCRCTIYNVWEVKMNKIKMLRLVVMALTFVAFIYYTTSNPPPTQGILMSIIVIATIIGNDNWIRGMED